MFLGQSPWALKVITSAAPSLEPLNHFLVLASMLITRAFSKTAFTTLFIYASAIVLERTEDRDVRGEEGVVRDIFGVHVPACRKLAPQLLTPPLLVELAITILP